VDKVNPVCIVVCQPAPGQVSPIGVTVDELETPGGGDHGDVLRRVQAGERGAPAGAVVCVGSGSAVGMAVFSGVTSPGETGAVCVGAAVVGLIWARGGR